MEHSNDNTRTHIVLTKGTMVDHYRIVEKIGAGGMGEVYLTEDTKLNREVALKFLPAHLCQDSDFRARFKREAQAAAKLNHPNIVTVYEVGEYQNRPFIAMEYCRGDTLRTMLKQFDITTEKAIELTIGICEGLDKAHREGVIHRDIKPANIVIDENGRARLLDFGLAAVRGEEQLTKTGSTLGTVGYMSPEQIRGEEIDNRSDLFSLGVLFYEMITGKAPFKADYEAATLNAILNDTPKPISQFKPDLLDELQKIISRMLEKDPDNRYQSAAAVISDLKKLSDAQTVKSVSEPPKDWWNRFVVTGAVAVLLFFAGYWLYNEYILKDTGETEPQRKMLAVLPFENLGAPEDEYFADGITDAINTRLASIHSLGVISRTSTMAYKNTDKRLPEIAKELGVDYILEGTILWDKTGDIDRVRIIPQLIEVSTDIHLWAGEIDREITDLFAVQAEIATRITEEMGVTLLDTERDALTEQPTENTEAYDYYLRGKQYYSYESARYDYSSAEAMHLKAIELEPEFALAYAELGMVYTDMYWNFRDRTEQRLAAAKEVIDKALELAPADPVTHLALGWYYYHGHLDYDRALEQFDVVLKKNPNNSLAIASIAYVQRRQGDWDKAIENLKRAIKLNPREAHLQSELANTLMRSHQYKEVEYYCDRAIDLAPDMIMIYIVKSWSNAARLGDTREARRILQDAIQRIGRSPQLTYFEALYDCFDGEFEHALGLMTAPGQVYFLPQSDSADYYLLKGGIYRYINRSDLMTLYCDSARVVMEKKIAEKSDVPLYHSLLGRAYAELGRKDDAIREGLLAVELLPVSKDALIGAELIRRLAEIYVIVGEYDPAIDRLEYLMSNPSNMSALWLRKFPDWDPLRDHPRFQALLKKYEKIHGT